MTAPPKPDHAAGPDWSRAFRHPVKIRFYQADPAGILYFGRIFELVGDAFEELMRAAGIDMDALLRHDTLATPIVHAEADFSGPMRVGEELWVAALVERIGASSASMIYRVEGKDGSLRATANVIHVWVGARTWRKVEVPAEVRAKLERYTSAG